MAKKRTLAIALEFGFHDLKKYVHSGLAQALSAEYDIRWLILNKGNKSFEKIVADTGFPFAYVQPSELTVLENKAEAYNQAVRRSWMVNNNLGLFHNYQRVRAKTWKTKIIGNPVFKQIAEYRTLKSCKTYVSPKLASRLQNLKIDKILLSGYTSIFIKNIIATAITQDKQVYCIVNSWKDLYVNNFIPTTAFEKLFVWDEKMKENYLYHMPYLDADSIIPTGNPSFDFLIDSKPKYDRDYYAIKYNISKDASWLYYTMMPPGVVENEIETIQMIASNLFDKYQTKYFLLVRRNPNHSKTDFSELKFTPNTVLTDHYCNFDADCDMLVQSPEGEQEWLDLLHHTIANLSVPSTVTKEFMMLGKPVFNIAFNENNKLNPGLNQFFEAGFYRDLFDGKKVFRLETIDQLLVTLQTQNILESRLAPIEKKAVNRILAEIESE